MLVVQSREQIVTLKWLEILKFTKYILDTKIKEKGLLNKSNISNLKNSDLNAKLATLATKGELKAGQDKILKLHMLDFSFFDGNFFFW